MSDFAAFRRLSRRGLDIHSRVAPWRTFSINPSVIS